MTFWTIIYHVKTEILEMDTDSNSLSITAENIEDLIKPELKEQFE